MYSITQGNKTDIARSLLAKNCDISVQVLNEFAHVARRKLAMDWSDIEDAIKSIETVCRAIHPVDLKTHRYGISLSRKYNFALFDALIVATAMNAGATTLYSEDMQHDMIVEGKLRIFNPFKDKA